MNLLNFSTMTAKQKVIRVLIIIGVILLSYVLVFYWGTRKAREWADSEYLQERAERMTEVKKLEESADQHAKNELQMAAENDRLRLQNEASAELLRKFDAQIAGDAKKFTDLQKQREEQSNEITNASGTDTRNLLCDDAKRSGFSLSFCR